MIHIQHNFEPRKFMWLWAKYVSGINDSRHCTNCLKGSYSKKFSKLNPHLKEAIDFDEKPSTGFSAIYICGVSARGYAKHLNYPHNVHLAITPELDAIDEWEFEDWRVYIQNGRVMRIPEMKDLPGQYATLPPEFTTCRIFRWAVCWDSGKTSDRRILEK